MAEDRSFPWREELPFAAWLLLGVAVAAVLGFVVVSFIGTFVFGVFFYYATRPVYRQLRRRVRPPSLAAAASLFLLALPVLALVGVIALLAVREATQVARRNQLNVISMETQTYIYAQPYLNLVESPARLLTSPDLLASLRQLLSQSRPVLGAVGNGLVHLFLVIGIAFYLLRDDHRLSGWVRDRFADEAGVLEAYLDAVDRDYHQVFFGNILNAVLTGLIGAVTYSALDFFAPSGLSVPVPVLLGLVSGVASLVPLVGMKIVYVPATVYLLGTAFVAGRLDALWFPLAFGLIAFVVVDVIPDLVLRPYVSGRRLHVGTVMFAYILGPLLFGWYGLFLGPMLLVVVVEFLRVVLPEIRGRFEAATARADLSGRPGGHLDVAPAGRAADSPDEPVDPPDEAGGTDAPE